MALKYMKDAARGVGSSALDAPVAALAALSVAFVAYAMPADLLAQMVEASGLPSILTAAQPPLGAKARIGASVAGGIAAFAIVFLFLRLIDRASDKNAAEPEEVADAPPRQRSFGPAIEPVDDDSPAPRLRRSDVHPDAPARRPLFVSSDIGEPFAGGGDALFGSPPESAKVEPAEAPADGGSGEPDVADMLDAPQAERPLFEPLAPEPEQQAVAEVPAPVAEAAGSDSIPALMARLERGISQRRAQQRVASTPASAPRQPRQAAAPPTDERLQSAIDNLQRLAKGI